MYYSFSFQFFIELSLGFGLIIGSFINVVVYRYPIIIMEYWRERSMVPITAEFEDKKNLSLYYPNSHCPYCEKNIRWYDNIPIISWLILLGSCRYCDERISVRYPFVELITALCFFFSALIIGYSLWAVAVMMCSALLITASLIDFDNQWLPDALTYPVLWLGIICSWAGFSPLSLNDSIAGVIVGFLSFGVLYFSAKKIIGKEALGFGDVILFSALGAWVGPLLLIYVALISSMFCMLFMLVSRKQNESVAFGPWLSISGLMFIIFGDYATSLLKNI